MAESDPRRALDLTPGDTPDPEFVAALRRELTEELAVQSGGTRTVTPDISITDLVLEPDMEKPMDSNKRMMAIVGAAAAIILLIVGIVVLNDDDDPLGTDVVDQPESPPTGSDEPATTEEPPPVTTASIAPTTTPTEPSWDFEITYIDVPADNNVAADADTAWVAAETGVLSRIDLATNTVVDSYEITAGAVHTFFGFGTVWIGYADGTVDRFDPETELILATIELGGPAGWHEASEDSMWASNGSGGQALRIDPTTNTVVARIDLGESAGAIKPNESGVWIRGGSGTIYRIDPATNELVATIATPTPGGSMMASPNAVWAPGGLDGLVYRIDPATESITAEVDVSAAIGVEVFTHGIHFAGDTVWVRYQHSCAPDCVSGVVRIEEATNEVVAFQEFREGWQRGGMNVGPTTAWTFSDDAVARMDF
jgi:hypothetical protein